MLREAVANAKSQPVFTFLTLIMVIGMILAVMLTSGRALGAEQRVIDSIDATGTRMIIVRANNNAGMKADVRDRLAPIEGIEWAAAFTYPTGAKNVLIPPAPKFPYPTCSHHHSQASASLTTSTSTETPPTSPKSHSNSQDSSMSLAH